jgi:hypothetical protein
MKLNPHPFLVFCLAMSALGLIIIGLISQRNAADMLVSHEMNAWGRTLQMPLKMTQMPPSFKHPCDRYHPRAQCHFAVYLIDQNHEDRIRLLLHEGAGASAHSVPYRYGDQPIREATAEPSVTRPMDGLWRDQPTMLQALYAAVFAAFGLLVLWRGRAAAVWLGLFCLCLGTSFLNYYGVLPPDGIVAAWTTGMLLRHFAGFALVAMALVLALPYLRPRTVNILASLGFALMMIAALLLLVPGIEGIYWGYIHPRLWDSYGRASGLVELLLFAILPLSILLYARSKASEPERSRLAIVAAVVAIGICGPIIDGAMNGADHFSELTLFALLIPLGFTYTIPRYHVIDVGFVVNRVVIYALLIGVVSAVVSLLEVVFTTLLRSPGTFFKDFQNELVSDLPKVFLIALILRAIHQHLETVVNQVLFRKRHQALKDLRHFIKHTDFAQTREGLLQGAVDQIGKALGTRGVAIYEKDLEGYARVAYSGAFPVFVKEDDQAVWFMRAERRHVRLADMRTALGESGVAFPMCMRTLLYGAIVCGSRTDEQYEGDYAPDEIAVMQELAGRLAEQLFAFAAEDRLAFVNEIANGELQGKEVTERAEALRVSHSPSVIDGIVF